MTNPKHTDTSRSGDLVKWLRSVRSPRAGEAADRIEALEAENERLRAIVQGAQSIFSECKVTFGVCACGEDMETHGGSHTPMDQAQVAVNRWIEAARAALKEIDNGDR